jgi:hypothetical protein
MQTINPFELILSRLDQLQSTVNVLTDKATNSTPGPAVNPDRLVDLSEAAEILRKPVGTVRYYIHHRSLPAAIPISRQTKEDFNGELATLIQIIEIYSDRYPDRAIRLGGENRENFQLYQAAIEKYLDKINSLFLFEIEEKGVLSETNGNRITVSLLLKRKPIPYLNLSTIRTLWNSQSRLFGKNVTVEFSKAITLRGCMPADLSSSKNNI